MPRKKHCFHYLYKTTNLINNKYYYGMHSTSNLNDEYLGSGKILRRAIRKYGKENFKREILQMFDTRDELIQNEINLINEDLLNDPMCMNLKHGGTGGFTNKDHQLKCTLIASIVNIGNKYYKNKVTVKDIFGNTSSVSINDERYLSSELVSIMKNKIIAKDKEGKILHVFINDERYLSGELVGIWKDRKHSENTKNKISEKAKERIGNTNSQFGTCWITKDNINKKIKKEELDQYLNLGWSKGRKMK